MDWLEQPEKAAAHASTSGQEAHEDDDTSALHFYVKDTGIGLSNSSINTIFNSFQQVDLSPTRKYDGSGLGLAIQSALVRGDGRTHVGRVRGPGHGRRLSLQHPVQGSGSKSQHRRRRSRSARGCPIEAKKEAAARLAVRASGAVLNSVKTMERTLDDELRGACARPRTARVAPRREQDDTSDVDQGDGEVESPRDDSEHR